MARRANYGFEKRQKEIRLAHRIDDFFAKYAFYGLAYNLRPTEIQGFLGRDQLGYWDEIVSRRASNFTAFAKVIAANPDLISLELGHMELISNFAVPLIAKDKKTLESVFAEIIPQVQNSRYSPPSYLREW